jgi:NADPH:quinone reductase-like Zn-dependent oxidoreductase
MTMKSVVFDRFGEPAEVLQVREGLVPEPEKGKVRVRMLCSPINPSDLMYVAGRYGRPPTLPAVPGFEGVGIVEASGGGLLGKLRQGRRVAVLNSKGGNWQEHVVVPAKLVVPVPPEMPDEQAATFFVNPASALIMIQNLLKVPPGAWLLQTAAGSALGRMVIHLGRHLGFRTINIVRRREQADELLHSGGDAVICSNEESIDDRVRQITRGEGVRYAIDAVGGETGTAVVKSLGLGGRLLIYGTLSDGPLQLDPRVLIAGSLRVEGFWLSNWASQQRIITMLGLFRRIRKLMAAGVLKTEIGATYPIDQIQTAVLEAAKPGRNGKILLRLGK